MLRYFISIIFIVLISLNTIFVGTALAILSVVKLSIPITRFQNFIYIICEKISFLWVDICNLSLDLFPKIKWHINGIEKLSKNQNYLMVCNHQTWVDLLVLEKVILKRTPFAKFFIKQELLWVPFIGMACWAMEFPRMKRYSAEYLKKNPHKKGKDLDTTKKLCQKLGWRNFMIANFLEGTRFTKTKHQQQKSPFVHLLRPRAGGIAYVIDLIGGKLNNIVNVTIAYKGKIPTFIDLMLGRVQAIAVNIEVIPVPKDLASGYFKDNTSKEAFQNWVNNLWQEKDQVIDNLNTQLESC